MRRLLAALLVPLSLAASAEGMRLLHDPLAPLAARESVPTASRVLVSALLAVARPALKSRCEKGQFLPEKDLGFFAAATGSFTRKGAAQIVHIFPACYSAVRETMMYLAAVVEAGRTVRLTGFEFRAIYAAVFAARDARDVDGDGLSELALYWGDGDGCCSQGHLDLLEWGPTGPVGLGSLLVEESTPDPASSFRRTVYVAAGARPTFVGVTFGARTDLFLMPLEMSNLDLVPIR